MLPTLLAAAMILIAGLSSDHARPSSTMKQPAAHSAPAGRPLDLDVTGPPLGLAGNSVSPLPEAGDYRLNESKVSNGSEWSSDNGASWLSESLVGSAPLPGVTFRLRAKRLLDKFDVVGGGSGSGPPQYAGRKHLMLNIVKNF